MPGSKNLSSYVRIIPRLDIKGPNLVKGVHLEGLRVLGKPEHFAKHYYEQGADELLYMDVVASLYGRNSLLEIVERTSKEIFIPLTVGGGIRTIEDIQKILRAGADKVSLNTAAIRRPELIREAATKFGSSTIVISIEALKKQDGTYEAYTDNGREPTGVDVFQWAKEAERLGAGELMITSIDREGTGLGFDTALTRRISESVQIPVIACGGAGSIDHFSEIIQKGLVNAVCMAGMLHYEYRDHHEVKGDFSEEGNLHFVKQKRAYTKVEGTTIPKIKKSLEQNQILCRMEMLGIYG